MGSSQVAVAELPGSARQQLTAGVSLLHPEEAVLKAMLEGWAAQQRSRLLAATTVENRGLTVRRLVGFTNDYPWRWAPADVEEWTSHLVGEGLDRGLDHVRVGRAIAPAVVEFRAQPHNEP